MSWSYAGPTTAKDEVRFLVGDTDSSDPLLTDEEITYLLGKYSNGVFNASIRACETIMAKFARLADEAVGQVKINYSQKSESYRKMIDNLRQRMATEDMSAYAGGISKVDKRINEQNTDRVKPDFSKHQQENQLIAPWTTQNRLGRDPADD